MLFLIIYIIASAVHIIILSRDGSACVTYYMKPVAANESDETMKSPSATATFEPKWVKFEKVKPTEREFHMRNRQVQNKPSTIDVLFQS